MADLQFHILQSKEKTSFQQIASWYSMEWKIPDDVTLKNLQAITATKEQFQVLMTLNNIPIGTGGMYNHVGLLDKEPRLKIFNKWMALVYTVPELRGQGYGAQLCQFIQQHALNIGLGKIHLFTDTAEQLYKRLGWTEVERLCINERNIVVLEKHLKGIIDIN